MDQFRVGISPHVRHGDTTRTVMLDVCIALVPSVIWGIYAFGLRALFICLISLVCCIGFEALCQRIMGRPVTVSDGSAAVSGLLLAMNLPVSVPLWIVPIGAFFAMVVAKQLFGGLGKNFVNPVLCARVILFVSFPAAMTTYVQPFTGAAVDGISSATPLSAMNQGLLPQGYTLSELLCGTMPGCIGEVSSLLLLAGFLYLLVRRVITWHIPVAYLGTMALITLLFPAVGSGVEYMTYSMFSGGLILGAVFMATDYVTSPVTRGGKLVYGVLCGLLTYLIRRFGSYPEGVSFAILMMNVPVWYLDRFFRPRAYGTARFKKKEGKA